MNLEGCFKAGKFLFSIMSVVCAVLRAAEAAYDVGRVAEKLTRLDEQIERLQERFPQEEGQAYVQKGC